jgi:hypothetical protein
LCGETFCLGEEQKLIGKVGQPVLGTFPQIALRTGSLKSLSHDNDMFWNNIEGLPFTANEGPVRIQYKCLVPIYVFPEMNLRGRIISRTEL